MKRARDAIRNQVHCITNRLEHLVRTKRSRHPLRCDNRFSFRLFVSVRIHAHVFVCVLASAIRCVPQCWVQCCPTSNESNRITIEVLSCVSGRCGRSIVSHRFKRDPTIGSRFLVFAARNTRLRIADFTQTFHSNEHRKILIRCWRWHFSSDRCMLTCWIIFVSRCCCLCCCKFGCHRSCRSGPPFMLNGIFQSQSKWYRGAGARALALRLIWFRYGERTRCACESNRMTLVFAH